MTKKLIILFAFTVALVLGQPAGVYLPGVAQQPALNTVTPSGVQGTTTYCYWVVAIYAGGNSAPAGPVCTANANATLSSSNYDIVTFSAPSPVLSAVIGYDILRTTTATPPTGACACAVSANAASSPVNDQSNSLSAYTVTTNTSFGNVFVDIETNANPRVGLAVGGTKRVMFDVAGQSAASPTTFISANTAARSVTLPDAAVTLNGISSFDCGTSAGACSNTATSSTLRIITGTAAATSASPSTVAITGISPAFTSATSYRCVAQDTTTAANVFSVLSAGYVSGSAVTFTGPNTLTDTIRYICIGN